MPMNPDVLCGLSPDCYKHQHLLPPLSSPVAPAPPPSPYQNHHTQ